jgi:hypothetical protein
MLFGAHTKKHRQCGGDGGEDGKESIQHRRLA